MKSVYRDFTRHRYFYLSLLGLVGLMSLTLHAGMQGADGRNYLRWTHSFVFDQDLHLLNDFTALGGSYRLTPTGFVFERVNIGPGLGWSPFYALAMGLLPLLAGPGNDSYPADGPLLLLWVNFTSWLWPILAGILTYSSLRRWFSARTLSVALAAVFLGTPVLFYMATFPLSSHPTSIFLAALLLYLWLDEGLKRSRWRYLILGLVCGWLMLVASYNIVFFLWPGLSWLKEGVAQPAGRKFWQNGLALGLGGCLGFLPQMLVFWFLFGSPFYSPYAGQLLWAEPYLLETLFSTFHGLFFFAPVLLLVMPGLWQLRRRDGWAALSLGLVWLGLSYLVSINVAWWAGASFGNRYFLSLTPFFVLGLSAFIQAYGRWTLALILPCVLWTLGLYLQVLNGVGLTSDSLVYPAMEIARGQITAYAHILTLLPQLAANLPWLSVPIILLPIFSLTLVAVSRLVYGWAISGDSSPGSRLIQRLIIAVNMAVILFVLWAGWRGEQTRATLASQGFYDQPHEVVIREFKEVAGRSGLVTRAMYHRASGQPDRAVADLKRASELWRPDTAAAATRLYLGPPGDVSLAAAANLQLDYPGQVRLIGYQILAANPNAITGELFWQKLAGEKSKAVVTPIVRAFDRAGNNLGNLELESPFPAEYIPAGDLFQDNFVLQLDTPADSWVWLSVSLAEDPVASPRNALGQTESGIIGSVNVAAFPPKPLASSENPQPLMIQPNLLLGDTYLPDQTIPVQFIWREAENIPANINLTLNLLDTSGKIVGQQEFPAHNLQSPLSHSTLCFTPPAGLPPGDYGLTFALDPPQAETWLAKANSLPIRLARTENATSTSICNLLQADFSRRYEAPAPQNPVEAIFDGQIKLLGYDLAVIPQVGSASARLVLHWQAQATVSRNYRVSLQLLDAAGQPVIAQTEVPLNGTRPTATWLKGEFILDEHLLTVPALAPGEYRLLLALLDEQTGLPAENNLSQTPLLLQKLSIP